MVFNTRASQAKRPASLKLKQRRHCNDISIFEKLFLLLLLLFLFLPRTRPFAVFEILRLESGSVQAMMGLLPAAASTFGSTAEANRSKTPSSEQRTEWPLWFYPSRPTSATVEPRGGVGRVMLWWLVWPWNTPIRMTFLIVLYVLTLKDSDYMSYCRKERNIKTKFARVRLLM